MTDSQNNDVEGLPTAAIAKIWSKSGLIEDVACYDQSVFQTEEFNREDKGELEKHELVTRKEHQKKILKVEHQMYNQGIEEERQKIKQLIQDKIRQAEEKIEKNNAFDRLNLNDAKARKQELEKLLEEIEGESDE